MTLDTLECLACGYHGITRNESTQCPDCKSTTDTYLTESED